MTTIKLGVGDDAIEVEDGASVPLRPCAGRSDRGTVRMFSGRAHVVWKFDGVAMIGFADDRAGRNPIDLAALRRERAPRVETVGGWTTGVPKHGYVTLEVRPADEFSGQIFWTHRPGNSPEKQVAFDAALGAWLSDVETWIDQVRSEAPARGLRDAARDLGYGAKR